MNRLHRCVTKTHSETSLNESVIMNHIQQLKQLLSAHSMNNAYRQLTSQAVSIRYERSEDNFEVELRRNMFGLYLIPVVIQAKTYWFILDSGAQISSLRDSLIQQLQVEKLSGSLPVGSVGGTQKSMSGYLVNELAIGSLKIQNIPMIVLDKKDFSMRLGDFDLFQFDGIIGWDILSTLDFEVDDVAKKFKVLKNRFRFSYQNVVPALFPIFLVKDEKGRVLTMGFDSGARTSWMNESKCKKYEYPLSQDFEMKGFGVHGMENMSVKLVSELNFYLFKAHVKLKNVHTGRTNIFSNLELDGILGNEIFRNRRIRIINSKGMVLLA